ncbi:MAG: hypothetical protein RSE12_02200 [Fuscovulum sp.]|jgi:hypothetical protein|nr:hypothetical protein [Paracoccaceae bacterium]MCZ8081903.1 hypothetical protein [Paracoccaceae bacterium]WRH63164.1 MAG: hypothetical protein RSE12_02200 [Fuscovulum sp.]
MIRNFTASALILAALTGAAAASSAQPGLNAGDVQLALSAGVQPGEYSRAELINIIEARKEGEETRLNYFLSGANRASSTAASNAGVDQLAASAGVEPGQFSANELQRLIKAQADDDTTTERFILSGASRNAANPAEVVTPGEAQLAASIGVDPAQYTLAELIAMQPQSDD